MRYSSKHRRKKRYKKEVNYMENLNFKYNYGNGISEASRTIPYWSKFISNGDVIFDIGTNRGVYAVMLAKKFSNSMVYCFDPMEEIVHHKWITHMEDNKIENAKFFNFGFSDREATLDFYLPPHDTGEKDGGKADSVYTYNIYTDKNGGHSIIKGKVKTMKQWCKDENIYPNVLKIDAEGAEYDILLGAGDILDSVNTILIEKIDRVDIVKNHEKTTRTLYEEVLKKYNFNLDRNIGINDQLWVKS